MKQAFSILDSVSDEPFNIIQQSLQLYLRKKWGLDRSQFDKEIIEELFISKNIDAALVNEVVSILESCEIARFTQVNPKEGIQKSSLLNKTKKVIERLENY